MDRPRATCTRCGSRGTPRVRLYPRLLFLIVFGVLVLLRAISAGMATNWWREDPESDGGGACALIGLVILGALFFGSVVHWLFGKPRRRCPECFAEIAD